MPQDTIAARARRLFEAHRARQPFAPFAGADAIGSLDEAYAVQDAYVALERAARGAAAVGYKIGLTSQRMQALLGIDSPIAGVVLAGRLHHDGHVAARRDFGRLGLECEVAVQLGRDLPPAAAPFDRAAVAAAVAAVAPAFELVDDRAADYASTDIYSLVADNSWNAGLVLGEFRAQWPELAAIEGVVTRDGVELDRGRGSDVLGHPFEPLAWLANHLARAGRGLRAGDVVATGSIVPTRVPQGPERCTFTIAGLGAVSVEIRD